MGSCKTSCCKESQAFNPLARGFLLVPLLKKLHKPVLDGDLETWGNLAPLFHDSPSIALREMLMESQVQIHRFPILCSFQSSGGGR